VIYELHVRDFIAAHDWKTLTDTLGYLSTNTEEEVLSDYAMMKRG
jgi:hypothetical protein